MGNAVLAYAIIQLLSTAYGLSVIETVKPIVDKKLIDEGYVLKNRNSMYKFNNSIINFFKGLIPFYYAIKAINLVKGSDAIERAALKEVKKGNYITIQEALNPPVEEEYEDETIAKGIKKPEVAVEKYVAFDKSLKNTKLYTLTETGEDEVEYDTFNEVHEDKLSINPYVNNGDKTIIKEKIVTVEKPREITTQDIVKAILSLSPEKMHKLRELIFELIEVKSGKKVLQLKEIKDIA